MTSPSDSGETSQSQEVAGLNIDEIARIADAVAERLATTAPQGPVDVRMTEYMSYVAPLPPPEWYEGYDAVVPGAGHRILTMVEDEGKHRRYMDRSYARYRLLGLNYAFLATMAIVGSGVFLIHENKKAYGFALILANVVGLIGLFIAREVRRNGNGERANG
jgi:uncharacterized membrane protein